MLNNSHLTHRRLITKTLNHVLLGAITLAAVVLLVPARSEARIRVSARIGTVRIGYHDNCDCGSYQQPYDRDVRVRTNGRHRRVVRIETQNRCGTGWDREYGGNHSRYVEVWISGHYETKTLRNGRQKTKWVPGHWKLRKTGFYYHS